jgi:Na+-driven multidrug efflux pump
MAFSIASLWVFRLPVAFYLVAQAEMGATGIWIGIAVSNVLSLGAAGLWYLRGTWAEKVIQDSPTEAPSTDD